MLYRDRTEAGRVLASHLADYAHRDDVVVLALPRGGVPVAEQVARAIDVPLDVFVVRKLGLPGQEELAMGAIASGGVRVLNEDVIEHLAVPERVIETVLQRERDELARREFLYRECRPLVDVTGKTVILVDDGLATGSTMLAAVQAVRRARPARVIVAVPVGASEACASLAREADGCVCPATPEPFCGVGRWYRDFTQTSDVEVREILEHAYKARQSDPAAVEAQHTL